VLERAAGSGALLCVSWNERAQRAPPPGAADAWFDAAGDWAKLIASGACAVKVALAPGEAAVWDNRRVLHGREAYADADGDAPRWLQGCYVAEESVLGAVAAGEGEGEAGEGEAAAAGEAPISVAAPNEF
jgi:hypothetical protein